MSEADIESSSSSTSSNPGRNLRLRRPNRRRSLQTNSARQRNVRFFIIICVALLNLFKSRSTTAERRRIWIVPAPLARRQSGWWRERDFHEAIRLAVQDFAAKVERFTLAEQAKYEIEQERTAASEEFDASRLELVEMCRFYIARGQPEAAELLRETMQNSKFHTPRLPASV